MVPPNPSVVFCQNFPLSIPTGQRLRDSGLKRHFLELGKLTVSTGPCSIAMSVITRGYINHIHRSSIYKPYINHINPSFTRGYTSKKSTHPAAPRWLRPVKSTKGGIIKRLKPRPVPEQPFFLGWHQIAGWCLLLVNGFQDGFHDGARLIMANNGETC